MSPEQVRAARNWLAWTQAELATRASVGLSTIKDYESGKRVPITNNLDAIKRALENGGIIFTQDSIRGPIASRLVDGS
jgi:ribosome-binding protein aMBF1 (putative translation factor)